MAIKTMMTDQPTGLKYATAADCYARLAELGEAVVRFEKVEAERPTLDQMPEGREWIGVWTDGASWVGKRVFIRKGKSARYAKADGEPTESVGPAANVLVLNADAPEPETLADVEHFCVCESDGELLYRDGATVYKLGGGCTRDDDPSEYKITRVLGRLVWEGVERG